MDPRTTAVLAVLIALAASAGTVAGTVGAVDADAGAQGAGATGPPGAADADTTVDGVWRAGAADADAGADGANGADALGTVDEFEPNDNVSSAPRLEPPLVVSGLTTNASDGDLYRVDLDRGDRLNVSVGYDYDDGDVDLFVFDPSQTRIASAQSTDDDESVSVQTRESGTHYVLVQGRVETTVTYSLTVKRSAGELPDNDEFERNDGFASATNVTLPFERDDLRLVSYDADYYAIESNGSVTIDASTRFDHEAGDVELELYDPDRNPVGYSLSSTDNESITGRLSAAGTYYLVVTTSAGSTVPYSLSLSVNETTGDGTHESGVPEETFVAVAGEDGLDRADVLNMVESYVGETPVDGVELTRSVVLALVRYYVTQ